MAFEGALLNWSDEELAQYDNMDFGDLLPTQFSPLDSGSLSSPSSTQNELYITIPALPSPPTSSSESCYSSQIQAQQQTPMPALNPIRPFVCTHRSCNCGAAFRRHSELKKHVEKQTRPYACDETGCGRTFGNNHDKIRHLREVHEREVSGAKAAKIRCPVPSCKRHAKAFARKSNLASHMHNMHSRAEAAQFALADRAEALRSQAQQTEVPQSTTNRAPVPQAIPEQPASGRLRPAPSPGALLSPAVGVPAAPAQLLPAEHSAPSMNGPSQQMLMSVRDTLCSRREVFAARLQEVESTLTAVEHAINVLGASANS